MAAYQKIATYNNHVQAYDFGSTTDANQFAEGPSVLVA